MMSEQKSFDFIMENIPEPESPEVEKSPVVDDVPVKNKLDSYSLVQKLFYKIGSAESDYNKFMFPDYPERPKTKKAFRSSMMAYYENGIQDHADDICAIIEMLIEVGYGEELFGDFKEIKKKIENSSGKEASKYLHKLMLRTYSIIPVEMTTVVPEIIEPSITNSSNVDDA